MAEDVEKTEEPTPKRRTEARREGQIAISQESFVFANLFAVSLVLLFLGPLVLHTSTSAIQAIWTPRTDLTLSEAVGMMATGFRAALTVVTPVFVATLVSTIGIGQLQTRGNLATARLRPKASNLSPVQNFNRIFKKQALIELPKSILKILTVAGVIALAIWTRLDDYLGLMHLPLPTIAGFQLGTIIHAYLAGCAALLLIAIIDYSYQYWRTEQALRMSKQEVKEERKQSEGDEMVKRRQRSLQYERARTRMMEAVPGADVVVTNPEHISIALGYDRTRMAAPRVLARGAGVLALRIRTIARESGVPIVENRLLARALYRSTRTGDYIPEKLYQAVAEVLAYVYRLNQSRRPAAW